MLQAQFIATAMTVRTNPAFGVQCVYVPLYLDASGKSAIASLLTKIDAFNPLSASVSTATRIEIKTLLDDINNNRTLACA
jgi:hypothetical protein